MASFGEQLRYHRRRSVDEARKRPLSQERLGELIGMQLGFVGYSGATVSYWENGKSHINKDERPLLLAIIKILYQNKGLQTVEEADRLLLFGNYRPLNEQERKLVASHWESSQQEAEPLIDKIDYPLPPPNYIQLFGRQSIVDKAYQQLIKEVPPWIVCLVGLGGIGKTAVAHAIAVLASQQNDFDSVIWVSMEKQLHKKTQSVPHSRLNQTIVMSIGEHLFPDKLNRKFPDMQHTQVHHWLKSHRYLIIIDNIDIGLDLTDLFEQLNALASPSQFLLTMRVYPPVASNILILPISELSTENAIHLLREQATMSHILSLLQLSDEELAGIVKSIGGHPQALRLIPRLALIQPLTQLKTEWRKGQTNHVRQIYQHIYGRVWHSFSLETKKLLQVMQLIAGTGTTLEHLLSICDLEDSQFWDSISELIESTVLEPKDINGARRYGIHDLTRQFLSNIHHDSSQDSLIIDFRNSIIQNLFYWRQKLTDTDPSQFTLLEQERHNLFIAIRFYLALPHEQQITLENDLLILLKKIYDFVEKCGYWHEWLSILEFFLVQEQQTPHISVQLFNQLGNIYRLISQYTTAIDYHQKALACVSQIEDDVILGQICFNLGTSYLFARRYDEAEISASQALKIFQQSPLPPNHQLAAILHLLGSIAQWQELWKQAEIYFSQAITIWYQLDKPSDLTKTLNNQAIVLQSQNKDIEALQQYEEAKIVLKNTNNQLDWIMVSLSQGTLYFHMNQFEEAETCFNSIDLSFLKQSGYLLYHALTLNNLGIVYLKQQRLGEAELTLRESLSIWQQTEETVRWANTLSILGDCLGEQGKMQNAKQSYKDSLNLLSFYKDDPFVQRLKSELLRKLAELDETDEE